MSENKAEETGLTLVASILSGIQTSQLAAERRLGAMEGKLGEIHEEVRRTNGRVNELETWRDGFQDESQQAAAYAAGRESQRRDDHARLTRMWDALWSPAGKAIGGISLVLTGWGLAELWSRLHGGLPPW